MVKLNITKLAHEDLEHIIRYIEREIKNPKAADDFVNEVESCFMFCARIR